MEPCIHKVLIMLLFTEEPITTFDDTWIKIIIQEQNKIGQDMTWKGFFTQQWGDYMENHYRIKGYKRRYSGTVWAKRVF